jgi:hypothetical protein
MNPDFAGKELVVFKIVVVRVPLTPTYVVFR